MLRILRLYIARADKFSAVSTSCPSARFMSSKKYNAKAGPSLTDADYLSLSKLEIKKRPPNAFNLFIKDCMKRLIKLNAEAVKSTGQSNPIGYQKDVFRQACVLWRELAEKERAKYVLMQSELRKQFESKTCANDSPAVTSLQNVRLKKKSVRHARRLLGRPHVPSPPFVAFHSDRVRSLFSTGQSSSVYSSSFEWSKAPDDIKNIYRDNYRRLLNDYHRKLNEWEQRMVEQGRPELIRQETMIRMKKEISSSNSQTTPSNTQTPNP